MAETYEVKTVSVTATKDRHPWWQKIDRARAAQQEFHTSGERMKQYYEANYYKDLADNLASADKVYVNILFEFVKVMVPFLYSRDPEVLVTPKQKGIRQKATFFKQVLQYVVREVKLKKTAKRVLLDALLPGWGIFRVGYSFEATETMMDPERFKDATEAEQKMMILHPKNKTRKDGDPYIFSTIKQDQAWVIRWPWKKFYVDPDGTSPTDLTDHKFVIFESVACKDDLDKGGYRYPELSADAAFQAGQTRPLFEVWDRLKRKRILMLEGCNTPINKEGEDFPAWVETFPCVVMAFNESPDRPLPIADGVIMESQIREKNFIRTQQVNHRKRFNRRYQIEEGGADPAEILKWEANIDGSVIKTRKGAAFVPVQDAPLPFDVYQTEVRIDGDLDRLSGTGEIARGSASTVEQTATATSYKEQRLQLRTSERQDVVEECIEDVVKMLAAIVKANYDFPHVSEIVGPDGVPEIQEYTKEQLDGEYDIEIHIGSMIPLNRSVMIQQASDAFNLLFGKGFNDQELARNYLEALDWNNIDDILTPPAPSPMTTMPGQENPPAGGLISNGGTVNPSMMSQPPISEASMAEMAGGV